MTGKSTSSPCLPLGLVLAAIAAAPAARAAPTQSSLTQNDTPYTVASGDLIENFLMGLNVTGNFDRESIMGFFAMLDGTYGPQGGANINPGLAAFSAGMYCSGLRPAVSTALTPPSLIAAIYSG